MNEPSTDVEQGGLPAEDPRTPRPSIFGGPRAVVSAARIGVVAPDGASVDGRTQRRERNRIAVIEALLDIIRGGNLEPSAAEIADRAGVSHRSVFRYFADLDDLVRTAVDHEYQNVFPLGLIPDLGEGSLERRIDALVDSRLRVYAATYQVSEMARMRGTTIPAIDEGLRMITGVVRTQFLRQFEAELGPVAGDPTTAFIVDASMVLVGFESYSVQRRILGHSVEQVRQVWCTSLRALLGSLGD